MATVNFKSYVAPQQNVASDSLKSFIEEGTKQGFTLVKPKGSVSPVHLSKQDNPQMLFIDQEGQRVYLRISENLDAALAAGEVPPQDLMKAPIYNIDITLSDGTKTGRSMLVLGMRAEAQQFEQVDFTKAFATYKRPEPAKA